MPMLKNLLMIIYGKHVHALRCIFPNMAILGPRLSCFIRGQQIASGAKESASVALLEPENENR
jgi:hypothetical protein